MKETITLKERYLRKVCKLSGLPRKEFESLDSNELRELKQAYRSALQLKYKTRKKKIKSCWGVR